MGRIRPAQCRLPPALGSTKVFWSGMVSVVSWVCGTGESKGSAAPSGVFFLGRRAYFCPWVGEKCSHWDEVPAAPPPQAPPGP